MYVISVAYFTMSNPDDRRILNSVVNPMLPLGEGVYDDQEDLKDVKDEGQVEHTQQAE